MVPATWAENIVISGQCIKGGAVGMAVALQNALQRLSRFPLAVIGIIAKQHHVANAALPHFFKRRVQRIGAFVEKPGWIRVYRTSCAW